MIRVFSVLLCAALLAIGAAFSAPAAHASNTCTGGIEAYFISNGVPGVGGILDWSVNATAANFSVGSFRERLEVSNGADTLQVGLISDGHGLQKYVEYDGQFLHKVAAAKNTVYSPHIYKIATGQWDAIMDGVDYIRAVPNANEAVYSTVNNQAYGTVCNYAQFSVWGISPYTTDQMHKEPGGVAPDTRFVPGSIGSTSYSSIIGP